MYVPYTDDADLLPDEAIELINDDDPEPEVVLATVESSGKATCITLTAKQKMKLVIELAGPQANLGLIFHQGPACKPAIQSNTQPTRIYQHFLHWHAQRLPLLQTTSGAASIRKSEAFP